MVEQVGWLTATQTGTLTVTVHYTIAHTLSSGVMPSAFWAPVLEVGNQYASGQRSSLTAGTEAGTLSVTRSFKQGETVFLSVGA